MQKSPIITQNSGRMQISRNYIKRKKRRVSKAKAQERTGQRALPVITQQRRSVKQPKRSKRSVKLLHVKQKSSERQTSKKSWMMPRKVPRLSSWKPLPSTLPVRFAWQNTTTAWRRLRSRDFSSAWTSFANTERLRVRSTSV